MGACCQKSNTTKSQPLLNENGDQSAASKYPYQAEVLYEYNATEENQLSIKPGEIISIIDSSQELNGWALAVKAQGGDDGYIPAEYVRPITNADY
mmetsp:Transcript_27419/g.43389  ORF Transcript_27419/g.43389 Transcript_27419/m.43389 type:complete len:95 (-) Transcript_27419:400-684(-)